MYVSTWRIMGMLLLLSGMAYAAPPLNQRKALAGRALFEQELAAARKAGLPLSISDMKQPLPPADQNAAVYYTALGKHPIDNADWQAIELLYTRFSPTPEEIERAKRLLAAHQAVLDLVHKAVACDQCVLSHDWSQWPIDLPPFVLMRQAARWLSAESALEWLEGKRVEAVKTQALLFQVARHAASDRSLISYLVGAAADAIALSGMRLMLLRGGGQPGVSQAVRSALANRPEQPGLAYTMGGELASSLGTMGIDPDDPHGLYLRRQWQYGPLKRPIRSAADLTARERKDWDGLLTFNAYSIRLYRTTIPLMDLPYPEARARCQEVLRKLKPVTNVTGTNIAELIGDVCLPVLAKRAQLQALFETVSAGAAVLEYKTTHSAFPQSLDRAISPVPLDPFDRQPLRYRQEGDGFLVYSVGETGKFDGGRADVKPKPNEAVFRWPKPAYAR